MQFWFNWGVAVVVAVASILVVVMALFGGWVRAVLFQPKLGLRLLSVEGEKTPVALAWTDSEGNEQKREEDARYYHLRISNENRWRWPAATQVQVYLLRVDEQDADDNFRPVWSGEVPLQWRHQEVHPLTRTIGHTADCDLCNIVKGKWLSLTPLVEPANLEIQHRGATKMRLHLQVRAVEADSPQKIFQLSWDGDWDDGDKEMARHMVITEVS